METHTYGTDYLKTALKKLGAKTFGNKKELYERYRLWTENNLNKKLFTVHVVPPNCLSEDFRTNVDWTPLTKIQNKTIKIKLDSVQQWFRERGAMAGFNRGRPMGLNGFVLSVLQYTTENSLSSFYKGSCKAQMKSKVVYNVKIQLGELLIERTTCDCPAGKGWSAACKHVAAILVVIENYKITGTSLLNVSPTSQIQKWHKPSSSLDHRHNNELKFTKSTKEAIPYNPFNQQYIINSFIGNAITTSITHGRNVNGAGFLNDHCYVKNLDVEHVNRINKINEEDIGVLECKSRNQSNSRLWKQMRTSRITASIAGSVINTVRSGQLSKIPCRRIFSPQNLSYIPAIRNGIRGEEMAFNEYKRHHDIRKCGLYIDADRNYLGACPDGIDTNGNFVIEIKCPFKTENIKELKYINNNSIFKKHVYYVQIQIQMHVTKTQRCHFIVWKEKIIFLEIVPYNYDFVSKCLQDLDTYYNDIFCKEYLNFFWR